MIKQSMCKSCDIARTGNVIYSVHICTEIGKSLSIWIWKGSFKRPISHFYCLILLTREMNVEENKQCRFVDSR